MVVSSDMPEPGAVGVRRAICDERSLGNSEAPEALRGLGGALSFVLRRSSCYRPTCVIEITR
jgi:hypothetical protein